MVESTIVSGFLDYAVVLTIFGCPTFYIIYYNSDDMTLLLKGLHVKLETNKLLHDSVCYLIS